MIKLRGDMDQMFIFETCKKKYRTKTVIGNGFTKYN